MTTSEDKLDTFLQVVDPRSGYALSEISCGRFSKDLLREFIGVSDENMSPMAICFLERGMLMRANELFGTHLEAGENDINLVFWNQSHGLPYRLHTNRELILMADRKKPLSVFVGTIPEEADIAEIPDYLFESLLLDGKVVKREICEPVAGGFYKGFRVVAYALTGEEWRIDAYFLVRSLARKLGWSEPLTRMEGLLLGYSELENDAFITNANKAV